MIVLFCLTQVNQSSIISSSNQQSYISWTQNTESKRKVPMSYYNGGVSQVTPPPPPPPPYNDQSLQTTAFAIVLTDFKPFLQSLKSTPFTGECALISEDKPAVPISLLHLSDIRSQIRDYRFVVVLFNRNALNLKRKLWVWVIVVNFIFVCKYLPERPIVYWTKRWTPNLKNRLK
jgi:hypothetical protein